MSWITVVFVLIAASGEAGATSYVVGDTTGWTVPSGGSATYTAWASQHSFRVGDVLVFNFTTGFHSVAQVTKPAYDACTSTTPIVLQTVGPASLTINSTGELYYICTFGMHCSLGQKLAINVTSPSSTAPPTPAPAPATPSPPTMAPSTMPTLAPSPSSSPSPVSTPPSPGPSGSTVPHPPSSAPLPSTLPAGGLTPAPPPSAATVGTVWMPFVGVAMAAAYGFLI